MSKSKGSPYFAVHGPDENHRKRVYAYDSLTLAGSAGEERLHPVATTRLSRHHHAKMPIYIQELEKQVSDKNRRQKPAKRKGRQMPAERRK